MMRKIPKHITLILSETETFFLLDLPSCIATRDSEEGERAEADNQQYEYLTKGKGRNRKVNTIGVQTIPVLFKTRHTKPVQYEFKDSATFASNWEMYDTYKEEFAEKVVDKDDEEVSSLSDEIEIYEHSDHKLKEEIPLEELRKTKEDKDLEKLLMNKNYFDAALIIERLLANNYYNEKQKKFKGIEETEIDEQNPVYNYKLELLWTFSNEDTKNRCVTGISFNSFTEDIVAIGYGKYYFKDRKNTGVVMVWNIKNPKQPEREYYFRHAVTTLAFSHKKPSHLAVGFYNGEIKIFDISERDLKLVGQDCSTSFETVWDIVWFEHDKEEYFLACFADGRICKYHISENQLKMLEMMRINKVEGKLKGLQALRMFEGNAVSSGRYASPVCLSLHAANPLVYLAATTEGVIHKCSTNYRTHHRSMFKAHEGPIHAIKFSPFVDKVFATCGDDFQECVWIEGINEPLIVLRYCLEPVLDFEWSPSHSTIVASLRGMDINIWDFQRKLYNPQSQTESPTNSRNTLCRFTSCGRCLLVGDVDGNVHIFSISGLPTPAFFQQNLFFQSIKNLLTTNTSLVAQLEKVESLKLKVTESTYLD